MIVPSIERLLKAPRAARPRSEAGGALAPFPARPEGRPEVRPGPAGETMEGYLDFVEGNRVVGWAYDAAAPGRRLAIEVSTGSRRLIVMADTERLDLVEAGKGDGYYGFSAVFDGIAEDELVHARFAATGRALTGSPFRTDLASHLLHASAQHLLPNLHLEIRLAAMTLAGAVSPEDPAKLPEVTPPQAAVTPYPTRARLDVMMEPACRQADPEGLVSRYLEYELQRFRLDEVHAPRGSLTERLRALHWYLCDYGPRRGLPLPLSQAQIAFLNGPVAVLGLEPEVSVAAYSFITAERGATLDLNDPEGLRDGLYWWCTDRALRLAPGGELIAPAQIRALTQAGPEEVGLAYPLNAFARLAARNDPALRFDLATGMGRALLVVTLILRCLRQPHLTAFLPRGAVAQLLAAAPDGRPGSFEAVLGLMLGRESGGIEGFTEAGALRRAIVAHLARAGFSLPRAARAAPPPRHAALCLRRDPEILPGLEPGVAVIGPTRAASGLGQATRLSIDVLEEAGQAPAVLDFGLDNPAPTGFASPCGRRPLRTPRRINLLHLNAEAIPLAFAYLDTSIYDRSYNIAYVFWELDRIPRCQRLALAMLDEIWVASEYNREIYARYADVPVHNVGMAVEPLPDAKPVARAEFGIDPDAFVFLATFDSFSFVERKNPLGVLAAFLQAFPAEGGETVALVLKTQNRTKVFDPHQTRVWREIDAIVQRDPRIRIVDETLSYRELLGLKSVCDAYVSLHRSEGWGFGLIEAMQLRLPVIATGYSGNMEFCAPETARLVDYDLVTPSAQEYIFVERGSRWADPSTADAAAAMRSVFTDRAQAATRAQAAYERVRRDFGVPAIAARYRARLAEIEAALPA